MRGLDSGKVGPLVSHMRSWKWKLGKVKSIGSFFYVLKNFLVIYYFVPQKANLREMG